ncbi:MAG TPA: aminoacyl-tRNA hydrolase [Longimicrobiales bacterium]|nr:aminoacyl-tRNA hydrolase [Longimicrobiales bacterium]
MKVICGLGNPGPEYDATRHNVGWWLLDRLCADWGLGPFQRGGPALVAGGAVGGQRVLLLKPVTYMNRSGAALAPLVDEPELDITRDLMVVVDDVALDVGRVRLRPSGSAGGHNGLKSVEAALGTRDYPRLRIGVGVPPSGTDLVDWVLSPMPEEDEDAVLDLFPDLAAAIRMWMDDGIEAAMSRYNR